jgi:hypothetical protein
MVPRLRPAQEAELQRHRRRLVREGHIQELAGARLGGAVGHAATDSSANFEVRQDAGLVQRSRRVSAEHGQSLHSPLHIQNLALLYIPNIELCGWCICWSLCTCVLQMGSVRTVPAEALDSLAPTPVRFLSDCRSCSSSAQVLAEILQQRARVYDPHAASRKDFVRCLQLAAEAGL